MNSPQGNIYPLVSPQGISVLPDGHPACPRLPLIGLRLIVANRLRPVIDGEKATVTLSKGWF